MQHTVYCFGYLGGKLGCLAVSQCHNAAQSLWQFSNQQMYTVYVANSFSVSQAMLYEYCYTTVHAIYKYMDIPIFNAHFTHTNIPFII